MGRALLLVLVLPGLLLAQHGLAACRRSAAAATTLFVFDCGTVDIKDISVFSPGHDVGQPKTLVVPCYLVRHPRGLLLWDAGLPDSIAASPEGVQVSPNMRASMRRTLAAQLAEVGVAPDAIDYVAFSHMHFDHTGNANLFSSSTLLIQEEEYQAAFGPEARRRGVNKLFAGLAGSETRRLRGELDVFGDGSVVLMPAPGHTPGHQVLFLRLARTGPVVLSGDLYHFKENRERRLIPSFDTDPAVSLQSIERIEALLVRTGAVLWIQHDPEQFAAIPHAPIPVE